MQTLGGGHFINAVKASELKHPPSQLHERHSCALHAGVGVDGGGCTTPV